MVQELTRPTSLRRGAAPDTAFAFMDGAFVPVRDAKVSVLTHAFNYGTGVFEGIRAYWNATAPEPPSLLSGVTGCGENFLVSMMLAISRA